LHTRPELDVVQCEGLDDVADPMRSWTYGPAVHYPLEKRGVRFEDVVRCTRRKEDHRDCTEACDGIELCRYRMMVLM
jgi:hypothetical protein